MSAEQEPTMREERHELARMLASEIEKVTGVQVAPYDARALTARFLAVLERRGDDDTARVRRVRELAEVFDGRSHNGGVWTVLERVTYGAAAEMLLRALDGDDGGSGQ